MKKRICRNRKIFFSLLVLFAPILFRGLKVEALSASECGKIIYNNSKFFRQNDLFQDILRSCEWGIIRFLKWVSDSSESLYMNSIGLIDFTQYSKLNSWIDKLQDICTAIMALSITYFGVILIVNHKKKPNVLTAVMLAGLCTSALSSMMVTADKAVASFCEEVGDASFSEEIIANNLWDLVYIDQKKGLETISTDASYLEDCHYPVDSLNTDYLDLSEVINYDSSALSSKASDILSYGVTYFVDSDLATYDVYNGWGWNDGEGDDLFNEFYYRYYINGFPICVALVAVIIVYLCLAYKATRLIFELPVKKIIAMLYSSDITGVQKTLKILGNIKDTYIILCLSAICVKVFQLYESFLSSRFSDQPFTYCIFLLFGAFAVIDGPNIIQALTGEDAGLQTGFGHIMAAYQAGKGVAKGTASLAGSAIGAGSGMAKKRKLKNAAENAKNSASTSEGKANIKSGLSGAESNKDINDSIGNKEGQKQGNNVDNATVGSDTSDSTNSNLDNNHNINQAEMENPSSKSDNSNFNGFDPTSKNLNPNADIKNAIDGEKGLGKGLNKENHNDLSKDNSISATSMGNNGGAKADINGGEKTGIKTGIKAGSTTGIKTGIKAGSTTGIKTGGKTGSKTGIKTGSKAGIKTGNKMSAKAGSENNSISGMNNNLKTNGSINNKNNSEIESASSNLNASDNLNSGKSAIRENESSNEGKKESNNGINVRSNSMTQEKNESIKGGISTDKEKPLMKQTRQTSRVELKQIREMESQMNSKDNLK